MNPEQTYTLDLETDALTDDATGSRVIAVATPEGVRFQALDTSPPYVETMPDPTAGLNRRQRRGGEARARKLIRKLRRG